MMLFRFKPDCSYQPTPEERQSMQEQWGGFIGKTAISEQLVGAYQLGFEGTQIQPDLAVSEGIHLADQYALSGSMVVKANSLEEATQMAKGCPILKMGGNVEVRSIIPMDR